MNTTNKYIDIALSKLKICKQYGTGYFNNPLPKGCIYGRPTKNLYIYVNNFSQFKPEYNLTKFVIWVMDVRSASKFKEILVSKHTEWYNMIFAFIDYHNLFDAKVEPNLYRIGKRPERKQPQTYTGYDYNVPYRHRKVLEWENTYCTETDAVQKPTVRLDVDRAKMIVEKQKKNSQLVQKHYDKYKKLAK